MFLIISDASVLIDIESGGLSSAMFSLPWRFAVPDILFEEELSERHSSLLQLGLLCKTMSGDLISDAYMLRKKYSKTSVNDLLALVLAKHENCQLLTSDKSLRGVAQRFNIEVHGTIWLVQKMVECEKITAGIACVSFQRMKNAGSRLPWFEVVKIFNCEIFQ